jgi:excinuclease ABC subunit C
LWRSLPAKPGVYIFKNEKNKVIYVGKAKDLKKRVGNYFSNKALDGKTLRLVAEAASFDTIVVASEIEAFLLEANLIKKYKPHYNIIFTDDKSYPYLEINKKPIPYIVITHKKTNKNAIYLGPYVGVGDLKIVLRLLRRIFPFQSVKNHATKRCLYYHLGLCPCVQVFPERVPEYKKNIRNLVSFLKGDKNRLVRDLKKEQGNYVRNEEFEKAGFIQRQIEGQAHPLFTV